MLHPDPQHLTLLLHSEWQVPAWPKPGLGPSSLVEGGLRGAEGHGAEPGKGRYRGFEVEACGAWMRGAVVVVWVGGWGWGGSCLGSREWWWWNGGWG